VNNAVNITKQRDETVNKYRLRYSVCTKCSTCSSPVVQTSWFVVIDGPRET